MSQTILFFAKFLIVAFAISWCPIILAKFVKPKSDMYWSITTTLVLIGLIVWITEYFSLV
jgi:hypothetical protein